MSAGANGPTRGEQVGVDRRADVRTAVPDIPQNGHELPIPLRPGLRAEIRVPPFRTSEWRRAIAKASRRAPASSQIFQTCANEMLNALAKIRRDAFTPKPQA